MDNVNEEEEKNVIDYIRDLKFTWPFSLMFPDEEKTEKTKPDKKSKDEVDDVPYVPDPIIGRNIDPGIDQGLGLLHFTLTYEVRTETLKILLTQGKNLVGKDPRGTSDPYAIITFDPKNRSDDVYETEVKKKTLNPQWNHIFAFQNFTQDDLARYRVHITILDWDKYGDHDPLGEVYYDLMKLLGKNQQQKIMDEMNNEINDGKSTISEKASIKEWVDNVVPEIGIETKETEKQPLVITEEDEKTVEKSASMIFNERLLYDDEMELEDEEVLDDDDEDNNEEANQKFDVDTTKMPNVIRRIEVNKHLQALPNMRSSYGEILISLEYAIRTRQLIVKIIKAKNMIDPRKRALIPYCILRHLFISNNREKTKSIHHTSYRFYTDCPVWNEEFPLNVRPDRLKQTAVEIQVFHSTKESKLGDDELGLIRLGLKAYPAQKAHYVEFLANIGKPTSSWHLIRT